MIALLETDKISMMKTEDVLALPSIVLSVDKISMAQMGNMLVIL